MAISHDSRDLKSIGIPVTRQEESEVGFESVAYSLTLFSLSQSDDTLEIEHFISNIEREKVKSVCPPGPCLPHLMHIGHSEVPTINTDQFFSV